MKFSFTVFILFRFDYFSGTFFVLLGTGHYLYPGLGLKSNYFELKKFIYPTTNNRKFSDTPPFISLKNNYPNFANNFDI